MTKIVGINGFKRSGKGETARCVAAALDPQGKRTHSVGFADKLKILAAKSLGFIDLSDAECIALMDEAKESWLFDISKNAKVHDLLLDPYSPNVGRLAPGWQTKEPVTALTGRQYLQHLGNQARLVFGENFWIDQVLPDPMRAAARALGTDTPERDILNHHLQSRYPGVDVLCITDLRYENEAERVKALGGVVWEVLRPGTASDGHDSEQRLPRELVDYQIHNDGSLWQLTQNVTVAIEETL